MLLPIVKRRFPKLARWLAGIYLVWSLLAFFGSLGNSGHQWWPIFLYPVIWPLSAFYEVLSKGICNWLVPDPRSAPDWTWILYDYTGGAFYIVCGTIWVWSLGRVFSVLATRIFPLKHGKAAV
jgi:hypothetical protein